MDVYIIFHQGQEDIVKMERIYLSRIEEQIRYLQCQRATAERQQDYKNAELYRNQLEKKIGLRDLLLKSLEEKKDE